MTVSIRQSRTTPSGRDAPTATRSLRASEDKCENTGGPAHPGTDRRVPGSTRKVEDVGKSVDEPTVANFKDPLASYSVMTNAGPLKLDMREVAKRVGGELKKGDVISVGAYRNGKGELVPMYDSIEIEREATEDE